ncbi:MAG: glycoside hydrolase family 99-like domain-containing protein [Clostridia bacterium]|nr:glycoside hydrolase family 99-like domain-containing protein [Clostridia bacterium]
MQKYDIAAYIWPAYTGTEYRTLPFWPEGIGEWQSVKNSKRKTDSYFWNRKPLWGYQDEADPKVMEMQIEEAVKHGVNVFIYDWYWYDHRPFLEQCLNDGFLKASNRDKMKFYIMWANHTANYTWDIRLSDRARTQKEWKLWDGAVSRADFDCVVERIITQYFSQPNYYKIDGKPVFMIYDVDNLIRGLGGMEKTREALEYFRAETVRAGFPGLELQLTGWGERIANASGVDSEHALSTREIVPALGFDSVTNYQFAHLTKMDHDYESEILPTVAAEWKRMDREYTVPYYPHVSIGWDNNPRFLEYSDYICTGNEPEKVEIALRMAKEYVDTHPNLRAPLITVNSWNEWTETSYLLPDDLYGYGYLEAIKRVFVDEQ